jgi:hypothetical protein
LQTVDNVILYGRITDSSFTHPSGEGICDLLKAIQGDKEVNATTIATLGEKGHDGFFYAMRNRLGQISLLTGFVATTPFLIC